LRQYNSKPSTLVHELKTVKVVTSHSIRKYKKCCRLILIKLVCTLKAVSVDNAVIVHDHIHHRHHHAPTSTGLRRIQHLDTLYMKMRQFTIDNIRFWVRLAMYTDRTTHDYQQISEVNYLKNNSSIITIFRWIVAFLKKYMMYIIRNLHKILSCENELLCWCV
jgi:hypothetical protein